MRTRAIHLAPSGAAIRPLLVVALAGAAVLTVALEGPPAGSAVIVVAFLLFCPGLALVAPLRIDEAITEVTLVVAVSLALETVVATSMLYAGLWSPDAILLVVAGLSAIVSVPQLLGGRAAAPRPLQA